MDDLLEVFLAETAECLAECDADAGKLADSPGDVARLDKLLRQLRSVRETSGFLGLPVLHAAARDGIERVEQAARAPGAGFAALVAQCVGALRATVAELQQPAPVPAPNAVLATKRRARKKAPPAEVPASGSDDGASGPQDVPVVAAAEPGGDCIASTAKAPVVGPEPAGGTPSAGDGSIRVKAETVENLLSTVTRLMAAQAEMMQMLRAGEPARAPESARESARESRRESAGESAAAADAAAPPPAPAPSADREHPGPAAAQTLDTGKVVAFAARRAAGEGAAGPAGPGGPGSLRLLVFRGADEALKAVAFDQVVRLEEVDLRSVGGSRGLWVMRSGAELFPLIPFDAGRRLPERGSAPVMIFVVDGQWFGLLVEAVLQVVDGALAMPASADRGGTIGTALVNGRVVEVIDPRHYLMSALRARLRSSRVAASRHPSGQPVAPALAQNDLFVRKPARDGGG